MKRAVLQFTACVLAAGMTVSGTGIAAFAAKDDALAGFGGTAVQSVSGSTAEDTQESETTAETQSEEAVTEAATEAATGRSCDRSSSGDCGGSSAGYHGCVRRGRDREQRTGRRTGYKHEWPDGVCTV